jgi:hypothetical protein
MIIESSIPLLASAVSATVFVHIDANDRFCRCFHADFDGFARDDDMRLFTPVSAECFGDANMSVIISECLCEQGELDSRVSRSSPVTWLYDSALMRRHVIFHLQ